jgi:pimeloyl-ACP methyl ester carboxylesterase
MPASRVLSPDEMYPAGIPGITTRYVTTASGLRVRIAEAGSGERHPAPVLLLHGWGCSLYAFRHLITPLALAGYRAMVVDLKGHGLSDKPVNAEEYTLRSMTDHALEVVNALIVESICVTGHSMGGRIAVELALRMPSLVERLLLINPVGFGPMPHIDYARPIANEFFARSLPAPLPFELVKLPVSAVYGRIGKPTDRDIEEYRAPTQFREFITASMFLLREFSWKPVPAAVLEPLKDRTTIVVGELDRVVRIVRGGRDKTLRQSGWDIRVVNDVAHVVHEEAPDAVMRALSPES